MNETDHLERKLLAESIGQWQREQADSMPSAGGRL